MKCADNVDAGSFSSSRKRNNENSGVPTVDIKNAIPANNSIPASNGDNVNCQNSGEKPYVRTSLPSSQTTLMAAAATDREARTSPRHCLPLLQNADQVARTVHVVSSATDSSLMYSRSDDDNAQLDNDDRTCYASKASKRKRVDEADSGLDESFHHSVQEYRSDASTQASAAAEATIPADYGGSRREQVATVAHKGRLNFWLDINESQFKLNATTLFY